MLGFPLGSCAGVGYPLFLEALLSVDGIPTIFLCFLFSVLSLLFV